MRVTAADYPALSDIIQFRENSRHIALRSDLVAICDGSGVAGLVLGMMISLDQEDNEDPGYFSPWIPLTAEEMQEELLGMRGVNAIRKAFHLLVDKGYLEVRSNPERPIDRTKQYRLNVDVVQRTIDALQVPE